MAHPPATRFPLAICLCVALAAHALMPTSHAAVLHLAHFDPAQIASSTHGQAKPDAVPDRSARRLAQEGSRSGSTTLRPAQVPVYLEDDSELRDIIEISIQGEALPEGVYGLYPPPPADSPPLETLLPSLAPTAAPTAAPTPAPTSSPRASDTPAPSKAPTQAPFTEVPVTKAPTATPRPSSTLAPTGTLRPPVPVPTAAPGSVSLVFLTNFPVNDVAAAQAMVNNETQLDTFKADFARTLALQLNITQSAINVYSVLVVPSTGRRLLQSGAAALSVGHQIVMPASTPSTTLNAISQTASTPSAFTTFTSTYNLGAPSTLLISQSTQNGGMPAPPPRPSDGSAGSLGWSMSVTLLSVCGATLLMHLL